MLKFILYYLFINKYNVINDVYHSVLNKFNTEYNI